MPERYPWTRTMHKADTPKVSLCGALTHGPYGDDSTTLDAGVDCPYCLTHLRKDTRTMQILQIDSRCEGARIKTKVTLDGDDRDGLHAFLEAANRHRLMLTAPGSDLPKAIHFYTVTLYMEDETGPVWMQETGQYNPDGNTWVIGSTPDHQGITYQQTGLIGTAATLDDV